MESKNRNVPRDGKPAPGGDQKTSYDYRRIASRYSRPSSSLSLKSILVWMLMAIAVAIAFDRLRPSGRKAPPQSVSSAPKDEETNWARDAVAESPPSNQAQASATMETALPMFTRVQSDQEQREPAGERPDTSVKVILNRDKAGNYVGQGMINQKDVKLLADTGASVVVVPEKIAKQIGLKSGKPMQFRTAGGLITNYATTLDSLTIGPIQIRNLDAVINPSMQEDFALLGMNALELLHMIQQDGRLILSYDPAKDQSSGPNPIAEEPLRFKKSVKECLGSGKTIDRKTLDCLSGH